MALLPSYAADRDEPTDRPRLTTQTQILELLRRLHH